MAFLDNRYVEGSSAPLSRRDAAGNTYQSRRLTDGSRHEVLKNHPDARELEAGLRRWATGLQFSDYDYYWVATYCTA